MQAIIKLHNTNIDSESRHKILPKFMTPMERAYY